LTKISKKKKVNLQKGLRQCVRCKNWFPKKEIEYAPEPYSKEICNDDTSVWECENCRCESAMDV
jgi:hypothetical protein